MKKLLLALLLFNASISKAQNWQCLQTGVKHYFINSDYYLRGIRVDSIETLGDTIVYFPFHTPRGPYVASLPTDSTGGSWLGKRVLQKADGTFIFDNYWNDSVIIKTRANVGDSFVLYSNASDTSHLYYEATVTATDTMTISSILDSIKIIKIYAFCDTGFITTDSLNGIDIKLSKNNGFVQVCDLYTFPYHMPNAGYVAGLDYFLDQSLMNWSAIGQPPCKSNALFDLVNLFNPNEAQLHNWALGDELQFAHELDGNATLFPPVYITETIVGAGESGDIFYYTLAGDNYYCAFDDPCVLIINAGSYSYSDNVYLLDTVHMPEETIPSSFPDIIFYNPTDKGACFVSPFYIIIRPDNYHGSSWYDYTFYKVGVGATYYDYFDTVTGVEEVDWTSALSMSGISCGTFAGIKNILPITNDLNIYPNPVTNELSINANDKIANLAIINLMGQTIYNQQCNSSQIEVDVSDLPVGIYFIKVNGTEMRKFVKQ